MNKEPPKTKVCKACLLTKDISSFYKTERKSRNTIEYKTKCKECFLQTRIRNTEYDKNYHKLNKAKIKEKGKLYRDNNQEIIKECKKKYYDANSEIIQSNIALKYATDEDFRQQKLKREKERYSQNKEKIKSRIKAFQSDPENKKRYNEKIAKRRKEDINFGLKHRVSVAIRKQLKTHGVLKNGKSILKYLPYTMQELKKHLEKQFEPWMNWSNRGAYQSKLWKDDDQSTWTWNVDHIIPHSTFNYISMEEQSFQDCWALNNLRPLSAKQNILDGSSRLRH